MDNETLDGIVSALPLVGLIALAFWGMIISVRNHGANKDTSYQQGQLRAELDRKQRELETLQVQREEERKQNAARVASIASIHEKQFADRDAKIEKLVEQVTRLEIKIDALEAEKQRLMLELESWKRMSSPPGWNKNA